MDEGKRTRLKRISAWIGAVLFILLVINISTIQFQLEVSIGIYVFLIIIYLFFLRKFDGAQKNENDPSDDSKPGGKGD